MQAIGLNDKGNQTHVFGYTLENERLLEKETHLNPKTAFLGFPAGNFQPDP